VLRYDCQAVARPREHDEQTRVALVAAAEQLVAAGGPPALSVRAVAHAVGTTTRAVYSLFGSKEALVDALAEQAFRYLGAGLAETPETEDPAADLVELGATMYRRFILEHPSLYRIAFQRIVPDFDLSPDLVEVRRRVWLQLEARLARLKDAGLMDDRSVTEAAVEFNAMCEGLANAELRGGTMRRETDSETVWRDAFRTVVRGLCSPQAPSAAIQP
jgi:AcrR family transcriptional regulator